MPIIGKNGSEYSQWKHTKVSLRRRPVFFVSTTFLSFAALGSFIWIRLVGPEGVAGTVFGTTEPTRAELMASYIIGGGWWIVLLVLVFVRFEIHSRLNREPNYFFNESSRDQAVQEALGVPTSHYAYSDRKDDLLKDR